MADFQGHHIVDCPMNSNPKWDPAPSRSYVCHSCGQRGDHYITRCPQRNKTRNGRGHAVISKSESNEQEGILSMQDEESMDGRLSRHDDDMPDNMETSQPKSAQQEKDEGEATTRHDLASNMALVDVISRLDSLGKDNHLYPAHVSSYTEESDPWFDPPMGRWVFTDSYRNWMCDKIRSGRWLLDSGDGNQPLPDEYRAWLKDKALRGEPLTEEERFILFNGLGNAGMDWESAPKRGSQKYLYQGHYGYAVRCLFEEHQNVWVNPQTRPTALDLWYKKGE